MDETLLLHRIEPGRNMARFYALWLEPTLYGDVALVRCFGRIGTRGRQMIELHGGHGSAREALQRLAASKLRRGYRVP